MGRHDRANATGVMHDHARLNVLDGDFASGRRDECSLDEALVHNDQVDWAQITGLLVYRLDACNGDGVPEISAPQPGRVDAHRYIGRDGAQLLGGLLEQFLHVREDDDAPVPLVDRVAADRAKHQRFAGRGWQHDARVCVTLAEVPVDRVDCLALVLAQDQAATSAPSGKMHRSCMIGTV